MFSDGLCQLSSRRLGLDPTDFVKYKNVGACSNLIYPIIIIFLTQRI
ncbi:hypothetical protein NEISUBOT_04317 [Neisseria subflava NJ9703]|uniref:Uncharacterized protein n=1 Tax=Neisseria subflava NJ9703 TaxID=546268 RepID=A0A9W5IR62_NEISU|nr:hypothetical protein NEISUBOT_04317 [Neisseria subflava NJ9703]